MKTEYLRTAKNSYMIVKDADFEFEPYELQMVLQNQLKNLVPMQVIVADGKVEYWFDVTGMKTLEQELSVTDADRDMIKLLLESICNVKMELEEYLLDDKDISYTPAMIFRNRAGNRIQFCYIPGYHCGDYPGIRKLFEKLMQQLNHADPEAVRMTYGIYEICALAEPVLEDYREILYGSGSQADSFSSGISDRGEASVPYVDMQTDHPNEPDYRTQNSMGWDMDFRTSEQLELADTRKNDVGKYKQKEEKKELKPAKEKRESGLRSSFLRKGKRKKQIRHTAGYYESEKEEAVSVVAEPMPDFHAGETVCFSESSFQRIWELVYIGDGIEKNLLMEKFPYIIGKNSSIADGILLAETVSRVHARILRENDTLFLEDHNSTNGTYLNGHLIPMNTRMALQEGDHLIFATEEYVLRSRMIPNR